MLNLWLMLFINIKKKIYDTNHFIIFFKKNHFENGLKTWYLYVLYRYYISQALLLHMPHKPDTTIICHCEAIISCIYIISI